MDYSNVRLTWNQQSILLILLLISLFFPFYITIIVFTLEFIILAGTGLLSVKGVKNNVTFKFLWLFIIYTIIVSLIHQNLAGALIGLAFGVFMVYFTYYVQHVRPKFIEKIITISLIASFFLFIFALLEQYHIVPEWDYTFISEGISQNHADRVEATFANPNYYAMMLEFFIVFGLYKSKRVKKRRTKIINLILIICNTLAIFFTGNRTSFFVIVVAIFVFYFVSGYKKQAVSVATIVTGLILLLNRYNVLPRMDDLLFATKDRLEIWMASIQGIRDNLLTGQGPLTYMNVYMNYTDNHTQHAHNIFLDVLLSYGIIGVLLLAQPLLKYAATINQMRKLPNLRPYLALICSMISVVIAHGMTDVTILWVQTAGLFLMVILVAPNMVKEEIAKQNAIQ